MEVKPLCEWNDAEIRNALLARGEKDIPVTPTTRPLLLRKLERLMQQQLRPATTAQETSSEGEEPAGTRIQGESSGSSNSLSHDFTPESQRERVAEDTQFEGYYGVTAGTVEHQAGVQLSPFYTNKSEALKAIRNMPGARFKKFESQEGAEAFSQLKKIEESNAHSVVTSVGEKPNSFPGLKTQDLSKFRKLTENGDVVTLSDVVWGNPRHLISSGDAPQILQEGFRYNALHCAVRARQLGICRELFVILQSDRFWRLVYQDDSEETQLQRKSHLVDLYLNMQDKINNETPLHFACKLGYEEIVAFLMTFPGISTTVRNRYGNTPAEVVCQNAKKPSPAVAQRIRELLREPEIFYVPVLRTVDNSIPPKLGSPCAMHELDQEMSLVDETGTPIMGHALAGPMPPSKAEELYREWRSPSHGKDRRAASQIKRSDPDRGLERIGRQIAHQKGVGWTEYWDFLGCSCDLSTPEGLRLLEQFLAGLSPPSDEHSTAVEDIIQQFSTKTTLSDSNASLSPPNSAQFTSSDFSERESLLPDQADQKSEEYSLNRELFSNEEEISVRSDAADQDTPHNSGPPSQTVTGTSNSSEETSEMSVLTRSLGGMQINRAATSPLNTTQDHKQRTDNGLLNEPTTQLEVSDQVGLVNHLQIPDEDAESAPANSQGNPADEATSSAFVTPVRRGVCGRQGLKEEHVFLSGPQPTKQDYDVLQALCGTAVDPSLFPHLHRWLSLVQAYPEQERRSWRTPASTKRHRSFLSDPSAHTISPLVFSSPPLLSPAHLHRSTTPLHRSVTPNRSHHDARYRGPLTPRML